MWHQPGIGRQHREYNSEAWPVVSTTTGQWRSFLGLAVQVRKELGGGGGPKGGLDQGGGQ